MSDNATLLEKETLFFQDPECIEKICRHVSNGGSVIDMADLTGIRFCDIMRFIRSNAAYSKLYEQSLVDRQEWAKESILRELRRISMLDIRKLYGPNGDLLPIDQWPEDVAASVSGVDIYVERDNQGNEIGQTKKVKLIDKLKALELKGKTQALFTERHEHTGKMTLEDLVVGSYKDDKKQQA